MANLFCRAPLPPTVRRINKSINERLDRYIRAEKLRQAQELWKTKPTLGWDDLPDDIQETQPISPAEPVRTLGWDDLPDDIQEVILRKKKHLELSPAIHALGAKEKADEEYKTYIRSLDTTQLGTSATMALYETFYGTRRAFKAHLVGERKFKVRPLQVGDKVRAYDQAWFKLTHPSLTRGWANYTGKSDPVYEITGETPCFWYLRNPQGNINRWKKDRVIHYIPAVKLIPK